MSHIEDTLAFHFRCANLVPEREYRFHPERKWRFDFAFPDVKVAVECEGGVFVKGAHTRGVHFLSDCEKYNAAIELGWAVLRYAASHVRDGAALSQVQRVLEQRGAFDEALK